MRSRVGFYSTLCLTEPWHKCVPHCFEAVCFQPFRPPHCIVSRSCCRACSSNGNAVAIFIRCFRLHTSCFVSTSPCLSQQPHTWSVAAFICAVVGRWFAVSLQLGDTLLRGNTASMVTAGLFQTSVAMALHALVL